MTAPAGWYPATDGSDQTRYWDGEHWTDAAAVPPKPKPPANWYAVAERPGHERYWDGAAWTTAYRPAAPKQPVPSRGPEFDNSPAWLLVAMPFVILGVTVALLMSGTAVDVTLASLVGALVIGAIAVWDSRLLRTKGYDVSGALAFVLVPLYLFQRAKATRQGYTLPVVWIVAFVGYLVSAQAVSNHFGPFQLDIPRIEQSIKQQVDLAMTTDSTVQCPSGSTYVRGATFDCIASDSTGTLTERVTVHENAYVTWLPVPSSGS